jgi:hypothetical protein
VQVQELVGRSDFLFVGDGQVATHDPRLAIMQHQGRLLAPLPGYAGRQRQWEEGVLTTTGEDLLTWREAAGKARWYRGFRRAYRLVDPMGRQYPGDVPIWCNPRLQDATRAHLERRLHKTQGCLAGLPKRLGKRALKSREAIAQRLEAVMKRDHPRDFVTYSSTSTATRRKRYQGRGRPGARASDEEIAAVHWTVAWQWLPAALENAQGLGGDCPLITNDPTLTPATALSLDNEPYHPEQRCKWLQGTGILAPVWLKKPHRIEAFFCVVGLVLQWLPLIAREAARRLAASGTPLSGLKPNRLPDYRPTTEALLHVFRHVTVTPVILAEPPAEMMITPVHGLPTRVLQLMGLDESIYTLDSLSRTLAEMDSS